MDDHPSHPPDGGVKEGAAPDELRALRTELNRLKATIMRREALLRAAARALRRYDPGDRVAASIDTELGDDIDL